MMAHTVSDNNCRTEISYFGPYYIKSNCLLLHLNESEVQPEKAQPSSTCVQLTDPTPRHVVHHHSEEGLGAEPVPVTPPPTPTRTTFRTSVWKDADGEIEYVLTRQEFPSRHRQQATVSGGHTDDVPKNTDTGTIGKGTPHSAEVDVGQTSSEGISNEAEKDASDDTRHNNGMCGTALEKAADDTAAMENNIHRTVTVNITTSEIASNGAGLSMMMDKGNEAVPSNNTNSNTKNEPYIPVGPNHTNELLDSECTPQTTRRKEHRLSSPKRLIRKIGKKVGLVRPDNLESVIPVNTTTWNDEGHTIEYSMDNAEIKMGKKLVKAARISTKCEKENTIASENDSQLGKEVPDTSMEVKSDKTDTNVKETPTHKSESSANESEKQAKWKPSRKYRDLLCSSREIDDDEMEFIDGCDDRVNEFAESTPTVEDSIKTYQNEYAPSPSSEADVQTVHACEQDLNNDTQKAPPIKNVKLRNKAKLKHQTKFATESKASYLKKMKQEAGEPGRRHTMECDSGRSRHVAALFGSQRRWSDAKVLDSWSKYIAVVAIDFGTTYSGYAYSFIHEPDKIYMMRKLEGGDPGIINQKTPTTILLTPEGAFHSFGFAARDFYHDLEPKEATQWMYFERFKMMLYEETFLNKDVTLRSSSGKPVSAFTIFSYGLTFFKDHALQELSDQSGYGVTRDDIRWVITVPAIWRASAKQFMRQAAYQAGVVSPDNAEQLLIALEPEAASIYCRRLRMLEIVPEVNTDATGFQKASRDESRIRSRATSLPELRDNSELVVSNDIAIGTRYMVVDCGGGTVDITVHQLDIGGRLRELHRASGGAHGSIGVDREFELLLARIFGSDLVQQFKVKRPTGWLDLMIAFESRKRTAHPGQSTSITVSFPFAFIDFYKKNKGSPIEHAVKKYGEPGISWTSHGMMRLTPCVMRQLFRPTVDRIKQSIGDVMNHHNTRDLTYMFLVGGFAESAVLQSEIRKDFGRLIKVIIPQGVGMTIVKGAVLYGLDPSIVNERLSRVTYGVGVLNRFKPDIHPPEKKVTKDGTAWCTDIFDVFVRVDQSVAIGESVIRSYTPVRRGQTSTVIHIFSSETPDVTYVTDDGVQQCGALKLSIAEEGTQATSERREIKTVMRFGDTEIKVTATDVKSGHFVEASVDFFNA